MEYEFTEGVQRVLDYARRWSPRGADPAIIAPSVLLGLLAEAECRAAAILARCGIDEAAIRLRWPDLPDRPADGSDQVRLAPAMDDALAAAAHRLRDYPRPLTLATEHVLLGIAAHEDGTGAWLRAQGLDPDELEQQIHRVYGYQPGPLPLEDDAVGTGHPARTGPQQVPPESSVRNTRRGADLERAAPRDGDRPAQGPALDLGVVRVLDAAANRAREGLRVVEDYVRFVLDDRHLTAQLKELRHALADALAGLPVGYRLGARETLADVGTALSTENEQTRHSAAEVLTANFLRAQEGLRTLEELGKLRDPQLAAAAKQLRYRAYSLQRAVHYTASGRQRLAEARLYVLIEGCESVEQFDRLVAALVAAGAHLIQLRDKQLEDRQLLDRARRIRARTEGTGTLFIMNDRPDLAALARADGVHVGQEEVAVKDARAIVGPEALVGVSTHSMEQARQAVLDGADYIGVGPTFPSDTKRFDAFPGLDLLRQVAAEIRIPAFAIGGIGTENLAEVVATGVRRAAVSGAVARAADPGAAVRELVAILHR